MIQSRNKWPLILMSLAMIAVVVFGAISFVNTARVRTAEQEIAKVYEIREATRKLLSTIVDTETGQRGFVITGEREYLEPYHTGLNDIDKNLDQLRKLVNDQPEQVQRLDSVAKLVDRKKTQLKESVALRTEIEAAEEAYEKARALIMTNAGKKVMDDIRALHLEILVATDSLLATKQREAVNRAAITKNMIVFGNTLALALAAMAFVAWRNGLRRLDQTRDELNTMIAQQSQLFDQVRDAIHICDMEDKIVFWNQESERVFGITEHDALGRDVVELIYQTHVDEWAELKRLLPDQSQVSTEWNLMNKDQQQIVVEHRRSLLRDWEGNPTAQLVIDVDVTDRKKAEVRTQRAQRLESIGTLAGGIAHDLNNVLSPILMAGKMIKREGVDYNKLSDTIVMSAERCTKMISKLLAFAGGERSSYGPINVAEIVKETELILGHALPKHIVLTVNCADELHPVKGDATEISQVLMNLAINARDAMPEGGELELRVENAKIDDAKAARSQVLDAGDYVRFSMSDTGAGIAPEVIDKIFDPFFTTKQQGKGTGLGLATTLGIVRKHNGEVLVYSEPEHGTTFTVYLPAQGGKDSSELNVAKPNTRGCGQTILLIDDEALIRETASSALELHGYRVITASGGAEAVGIYQHQSDNIDLIVLDVMMPGMDGLETRDAIRSLNPKARIIAASGLRHPGSEGSRMKDVNAFLAKPYSDHQLFELVARVLKAEV